MRLIPQSCLKLYFQVTLVRLVVVLLFCLIIWMFPWHGLPVSDLQSFAILWYSLVHVLDAFKKDWCVKATCKSAEADKKEWPNGCNFSSKASLMTLCFWSKNCSGLQGVKHERFNILRSGLIWSDEVTWTINQESGYAAILEATGVQRVNLVSTRLRTGYLMGSHRPSAPTDSQASFLAFCPHIWHFAVAISKTSWEKFAVLFLMLFLE